MKDPIRTLFWKDNAVVMLDQRALPIEENYLVCSDYRQVVAAIKNLTVRGAPAIGVAAAMGIALGALTLFGESPLQIEHDFDEICSQFSVSRPTARNLFWGIERMRGRFNEALKQLSKNGQSFENHNYLSPASPPRSISAAELAVIQKILIAEAIQICEEDIAINIRLGQNGSDFIPDGARILTHCNAGALATAGYGTALGVVRAAWEKGKKLHVYADETRPVLQGARLTAWELTREGIPCTLITDNMAAFLMKQRQVDLVLVGADRIAANGDTANKIGTYGLAVLAFAHGLPLYVAAPLSTIDTSLAAGSQIPIEEREHAEVTHCGGVQTAPAGVCVWNPAFDVTPADLITAIITEKGVIRPPFDAGIKSLHQPSAE
ncbi:MAG: S-methyl-5-thioribose-1-phosphate isomerase [Syntrophobacterales bacterium]|nr:S-methyl-5-thioribose-1-phosphate isomerase [Syntrophobacterales bacterium]